MTNTYGGGGQPSAQLGGEEVHPALKYTIHELLGKEKVVYEVFLDIFSSVTVKPLITRIITSTEFIKCRIIHFLIMECCRYLVF